MVRGDGGYFVVSAVNSFTFVKTVHIVCDTLRFEMDAAENIFTLLERPMAPGTLEQNERLE